MPNLILDMSELEFLREHYSFGPQIVDSVVVEATKALLQGVAYLRGSADAKTLPPTGWLQSRPLRTSIVFGVRCSRTVGSDHQELKRTVTTAMARVTKNSSGYEFSGLEFGRNA